MKQTITVFYDGACPLCVREIALLQRLDRRGQLAFEDVADPDTAPSCQIDRRKLLARFHVRRSDGVVVDGAEAFTEAWSMVPGLSLIRHLGRNPISRALLNGLYALFLQMRPILQSAARRLDRKHGGRT